jgi:hypothetical protein
MDTFTRKQKPPLQKKSSFFAKSGTVHSPQNLSAQRMIGNQAALQMLRLNPEEHRASSANATSSAVTQPGLTVSTPGNVYEQEADRVADQVIRGKPQQRSSLQLKAVAQNDAGQMAVPSAVRETLYSPGQPMDLATRRFMESRMDHDFSQVRVHADTNAKKSANVMGARAYTVGSNVVFGNGQYAPGTSAGRHLLAHELTHVVQQQSSMSSPAVQLQDDESWTPPTAGVVQAWMYNQIDNWHTGATQALAHFREAVIEDSSVGFWLQLAGNVLWAAGAAFGPAGAVATGLAGVAIATIGSRVQDHQRQEEYERVQDIYNDLLSGLNDARSRMDAMVIAEATRVMALASFQTAVAERRTAAWQAVVRAETGTPQAEDLNRVSRNVERNLYIRYLRDRAAWVYHDVFQVPSPHHPGTTSEPRHYSPHRIPERVRQRLERIGVDWRYIHELPVPHRVRRLTRREGTIGAIEYWDFEEGTEFPADWTDAEREEFYRRTPSYMRTRRSDITH